MIKEDVKYSIANITEEEAYVELKTFLRLTKGFEKYGIDSDDSKYTFHYNHEDDGSVIGFVSNEDETDKNIQIDIWQTDDMNVFSVWKDVYLVFDIYYDNEGNLIDITKYTH